MNKLSAYILLDRSGSMISRWEQAIASINAYVLTLAENADLEAEVAVIKVVPAQYKTSSIAYSLLYVFDGVELFGIFIKTERIILFYILNLRYYIIFNNGFPYPIIICTCN